MTLKFFSENAAERFADVVDFPIPPFPYRAICLIEYMLSPQGDKY
jgi:hypothetical protein